MKGYMVKLLDNSVYSGTSLDDISRSSMVPRCYIANYLSGKLELEDIPSKYGVISIERRDLTPQQQFNYYRSKVGIEQYNPVSTSIEPIKLTSVPGGEVKHRESSTQVAGDVENTEVYSSKEEVQKSIDELYSGDFF